MSRNAPLALAWPQSNDAPRLSDPACEWERRELLELGENIMAQSPSAWPCFQSWMTAVHRLSDNACKGFTPEAALTSLTGELRRLWLSTALDKIKPIDGTQAPHTPSEIRPTATQSGIYVAYSRDEDSRPNELECRCPAMPESSEWSADHIVFSSAQGTLASVLYWAITQGFWDQKSAPHLTFAGSNADTQTLLDSFNRAGLTWGQPKSAASANA